MIADLHCHYPMHVMMEDPRERVNRMMRVRGRPAGDKLRAIVLRIASALFSDRSYWSGERVNLEYLRQGDVRLVFSVLHSPFSEIDLDRKYGSPPASAYFEELLEQVRRVEESVRASGGSRAVLVNGTEDLDRVLDSGGIAMVHCLEGGVDLGPTDEEIERNVARLKECGLVYITLAHLFYRQVATNAPAIPFIKDWVYNLVFPQPRGEGLTERGRTAVRAMVRNRILVDVAHMRGDALDETFELLKEERSDMPVINSHAGYRCGKQVYMADRRTVERIAESGGVIGLILAHHQLNDGITKETHAFDESFAVLRKHIDKIAGITGNHKHIAIGSDFDGFIKPTMGGLETMADLAQVEQRLEREYGADITAQITRGNAERVLRELWKA